MSIYRIPKFDGVDEFLQQVAMVRGKLKKGGVPNTLTAARVILHDWNDDTLREILQLLANLDNPAWVQHKSSLTLDTVQTNILTLNIQREQHCDIGSNIETHERVHDSELGFR
ncbi:unnamed protein product [Calypogeia fissa]